jgi:single-stranded-DNA-specific exonuclease
MDLAVDRLVRARESKEPLLVFGDYDVDGTTGASLLTWIFREFGFTAKATQPDRFKDGYGLNVAAIEKAHSEGIRLVITVDCGITSFAAADRAHELGMDLIVVDHHQIDPVKGLPQAYAILNPQRSDCESGLRQLCGCGVGFYFARALRSRGLSLKWWEPAQAPNLKKHLDLVVMATAADLVPLTGDNHILVRHGLEVLKFTTKPGVKALLEVSGVGSRGDLSPSHLGFTLGPRINASGRMGSASLALELLTTLDSERAYTLAHELERVNQERAALQNEIWDQVKIRIDEGLAQGKFKHAIAVADASWHEGVVGIVASKVTEAYHKPAAILAFRDGHGKGSVRSFAGKDVLEALRRSKEHLLSFGGHRHAAGLSLDPAQFEAFVQRFDAVFSDLPEDKDAKPLWLEGECGIEDLGISVMHELERLGPFGPGNPEPIFKVKAVSLNHRLLKGRHLKLSLSSRSKRFMDAIWFNAGEKQSVIDSLKNEADWAVVPEINRFRGQAQPTLRVRDRKLVSVGI